MPRKVAGDREPRLDVWKKIDATRHSVLILLDERASTSVDARRRLEPIFLVRHVLDTLRLTFSVTENFSKKKTWYFDARFTSS